MDNFRFCVGTDIRFGKDQENEIADILRPFGKKVLLTYGGGSIKRTGLYSKLMYLLSEFEVYELSGIEPNPRVESVNAGAKICKEKEIDVILAVGGGSTIDCSKAIAAARYYEGDAWDMITDCSKITKALPVCVILTLAATGSEMDDGGVISNLKTNEKLGFGSPYCLPKVSILNPELTYTVPKNQTAAGSIDILSHLFEVYFAVPKAFVADRINEGLMKTVIKYAPIAIAEPENYEARSELMWASSLAINGLCDTGKYKPWSCHPIEHELSAFYDITHGVGLAIVTPRWMKYVLNDQTVEKFVEYAVNVWNMDVSLDKYELANKVINKTYEFFQSLGVPMTLGEVGIDETHFEKMAEDAVKFGWLQYAYMPLAKEDVMAILKMCL